MHGAAMEPARKIDLQPDSDAMRRHVLGLFGSATSGLMELAWISAGRGSGARLFDLAAVDELVDQAVAWALEGRNLYLGATLKHPDTAPFARTSDADAFAALAVWLDLDEPGAVERAERLVRRLQPTIKVTTGTVPHIRQHYWWRLEEAITDLAHLRAQVAAFAATFGGDPAVCNPGRLMRLAGSIAWPTKPGRVAQLVTMTEGGPTYTADMIARAVPFGATVRSETRAPRADLTFDAAAPQLPAGTGAKPQPGAAGTGSLGVLEAKLEDGREEYMRDTVHAVGVEYVGTAGAWPTADELFEVAWPQFQRKVDLSRPGRITAANAQDEMRAKCAAWVRKAAAGGHGEIERMVEGYQARQRASARPGPTPGQQQPSGNPGGFDAAAGGQPTSLPLIYASDITVSDAAVDFVEGLFCEGALTVVYGDSNVGKTFIVLDVAMHVALGLPWRGREVEQGAVIYCALEGVAGIRNRVAAWLRFHRRHATSRSDVPFGVIPSAINLLDNEADVEGLIQTILTVAADLGRPVKLVVIDTLSRALAGGNENASEDMGALVKSADRIRQATGAMLCFIHHSGKDAARGARGHSLLRAATDTEVEIIRPEGSEVATIKVTKQRELDMDDPGAFRLEVVELGTNRRGKPMTSCVAVQADAPPPRERRVKLSNAAAIGRQALENAIAKHGTRTTRDNVPGGVPVVPVEVWRREAYSMGISTGDAEAKKKAFQRATEKLCGDKVAAIYEELAWLC